MRPDPPFAILDSNVYIRSWTDATWAVVAKLRLTGLIVRQSSVVLSELRRGAVTRDAVRRVEAMRAKASTVWAPAPDDWWSAGIILADLGRRHGWDGVGKARRQNDVLIALTARRFGALVATADRDFDLITPAVPKLRVLRL